MQTRHLLASLSVALALAAAAVDAQMRHWPELRVQCNTMKCKFGAKCISSENESARCQCLDSECDSAPYEEICASNGVIYKSDCAFREGFCRHQQELTRNPMSFCDAKLSVIGETDDSSESL